MGQHFFLGRIELGLGVCDKHDTPVLLAFDPVAQQKICDHC